MRIYLLPALLLLTGLTACHRDKTPAPKQYSTWIVNNHDTFTTNNVDSTVACNPDYSYCIAEIRSNDLNNRFDFGFYLSYLPSTGAWPLGTSTDEQNQNPHYVYFGLYYKSVFYVTMSPYFDTLYAGVQNNHQVYTLPPSWFWNNSNHQDSILIQGVFSVP